MPVWYGHRLQDFRLVVSYIPAEESVGEVRLRPQEPEEDAVGDLQRVWAVGMELGVQVFQGAYAARAGVCVWEEERM